MSCLRVGAFFVLREAFTGNRRDQTRGAGWEYVHVAIDGASRITFAAILPDETKRSVLAFLHDAIANFASLGIKVSHLMTDNGSAYRSKLFANALATLHIRHLFTKPYTPRTNDKAERFIQIPPARMSLRRFLLKLLSPRLPSPSLPSSLQLASPSLYS
jgi:transposase InsO family protein